MRQIGFIGLLAGMIGGAWLLLPLRLEDPSQNEFVSLNVFWGVIIAFGVASACLPRRLWIRVVASAPFFVGAMLFPCLLLFAGIGGGPVSGYEVLDSLQLRHSKVVTYRVNGGATVDFSVSIVQEMSIFPGIVLVKDLHNGYHESTASLRLVREGVIRVTINGKGAEYTVRPFIYF